MEGGRGVDHAGALDAQPPIRPADAEHPPQERPRAARRRGAVAGGVRVAVLVLLELRGRGRRTVLGVSRAVLRPFL